VTFVNNDSQPHDMESDPHPVHTARKSNEPRWTSENRQFVDGAKPAISPAAETSEFYFVASSVRKSV
jgi:hypothetical protein